MKINRGWKYGIAAAAFAAFAAAVPGRLDAQQTTARLSRSAIATLAAW